MAATLAVMALAACSGPAEGVFTDNPTPPPELMFALEIPEGICPTADVIPDQFAGPDEIGYTTEYESGGNRIQVRHACQYQFVGDLTSLDGTQSVYVMSIAFAVQDEPVTGIISARDYEPVDFKEVETAEYFQDWPVALTTNDYSDSRIQDTILEYSEYEEFESFVAIGNLSVYSSISFVVTEKDHDGEPDLDIDEAAFQILEAVVVPVVAELERQ